jgi:hypothetical protein
MADTNSYHTQYNEKMTNIGGEAPLPMDLVPAGRPHSALLRAIINSIRDAPAEPSLIDLNRAWDQWFFYHCVNFPRLDIAVVIAALINAILGGGQDVGDLKFLPKVPQLTCKDYLTKIESGYPGGVQLALKLRQHQGKDLKWTFFDKHVVIGI